MQIKYTFLILLGIFTLSLNANSLPDELEQLSKLLQTVDDGKTTFSQSIDYDQNTPWKVTFGKTSTNNKSSKEGTEIYVFNFGDIEARFVQRKSSRSAIYLELGTAKKIKSIQELAEGELKAYVAELRIEASDVDNARALEEQIKLIIPLAKAAWEEAFQIPEAWEPLASLLTQTVAGLADAEKQQDRSWTFEEDYADRVLFAYSAPAGKAESENVGLHFSLGDINEKQLKMTIKAKDVIVGGQTERNLDFIRLEKDGVIDGFVDEWEIYVNDIDQARLLLAVLEKMTKQAKESLGQRLPNATDLKDGLQQISAQVKDVSSEKAKIEQTFEAAAYASLAQVLSDADGSKTSQMDYHFRLCDLKPDSDFKIKDQLPSLTFNTQKKAKLIQSFENGEIGNFASSLQLYFPNIESARVVQHLWPAAVKSSCELSPAVEDFTWLSKHLAEASNTAIEQRLEQVSGEVCKWELTQTDQNKKLTERVYEFNVSDLDAKRVTIETKGTQLFLTVQTNKREKIIKLFEEGDPEFVEEMKFFVQNLNEAYTAQASLQQIIADCTE